MPKTHFVAVHTDGLNCLVGCGHRHQNVLTATACIKQAGGYVVAVRRGKYRALTDREEINFRKAIYGREGPQCSAPDLTLLLNVHLKAE